MIEAKYPLLLLACTALLVGCAGDPRRQDRRAAGQNMGARAEAFAATGYQPAESASLSIALQQWVLRGEPVSVNLAYPGSGSSLPLVVYQPGLGESAQGGTQWRQAWARAGYVVLSLQPLNEDALTWSSDLARSADFKGLARHHYQTERLRQRQQVLEAALAEARQRAAAGDPLWARVDFERSAIAGYELGAQTALALAPQFRAALVLSANGAVATDRPLLVIGSARDSDPLGVAPSPQARRQSFDALPAGDRYLLWLNEASHAALAGGLQNEAPEAGESNGRPQRGGGPGGEGRGRQRGSGGGPGGAGGPGGPGGSAKGGGAPQQQQQAPAPRGNDESAAAITTASIAFFDAHLRQRPAAQQWLAQSAEPWLQGLGEWRQR